MSDEEEYEEVENIQSAWPILIGGAILGIILGAGGAWTLKPTETVVKEKEVHVKMESDRLNKLISEMDDENKKELEKYVTNLESEHSKLTSENTELKNKSRTELKINPVVTVDNNRKEIQNIFSQSQSITWITNSTRDRELLKHTKELIQRGGMASVLTSVNVIENNVIPAIIRGAITHKCNTAFSNTISVIIATQKDENGELKQSIIDVSNPDMIWVSKEPKIVKTVITWHENLINTGVEAITK